MELTWWSRARAVTEGRAARAVLRTTAIRDRLAKKRQTPLDGRVLDPELAALLRLDDLINKGSDMTHLAPPDARARVAAEILAVEAAPPPGVSTRELAIPCPAGDRPGRLYVPDTLRDKASAGVLFFHGGGFVTCDLDTHDVFCRRIALGANARVIALDYRLAPEHRYPAAALDAVAAFRWMAKNAATFDINPRRIAVTGDSAGGNLTAVVAYKTREDDIRPALQAPIYPAVDSRHHQSSHKTFAEGFLLTKRMLDWYYDHYVPNLEDRLQPDCSPLLAKESLAGLPPTLVYTAGFDVLRDEGHEYAERLRADGVKTRYKCFDSMMHGFVLVTGACTGARIASERIARDIGDALEGTLAFV